MAYNFTDDDAAKSKWWKKEKVGDSIQGTLVRKSEGVDGYNNAQRIYELLLENGEYWNVGNKVTQIDAHMRNVKLGQIVEFRFIEERPNKEKTKNATKVVQVFSNPNAINEQWLQEREQQVPTSGEQSTPEDVAKEYGGNVVDDKLSQINELAKTKLGATNEDSVKTLVMEKTGLAFIASNYDNILEKLTTI